MGQEWEWQRLCRWCVSTELANPRTVRSRQGFALAGGSQILIMIFLFDLENSQNRLLLFFFVTLDLFPVIACKLLSHRVLICFQINSIHSFCFGVTIFHLFFPGTFPFFYVLNSRNCERAMGSGEKSAVDGQELFKATQKQPWTAESTLQGVRCWWWERRGEIVRACVGVHRLVASNVVKKGASLQVPMQSNLAVCKVTHIILLRRGLLKSSLKCDHNVRV